MATTTASQNQPPARTAAKARPRQSPVLTLLAMAAFAAAIIATASAGKITGQSSWPDGLLLLFAAVTSVMALAKQLPMQNVLGAAVVIAVMGGAAHVLNSYVKIPFGPLLFREAAGPKIINEVPWAMPLLWLAAVLNSRGVARLVLRPWRKIKSYGYWLMGLTALLVVLFDLAQEPYATHARHYWLWSATKFPVAWFGATPVNFLAWAFVTLLMLAFVTPMLIRKQPGSRSVPDYHPLAVWLGSLALFGTAAALSGLWMATVVDAAIGIVTAIFAIRGGRW